MNQCSVTLNFPSIDEAQLFLTAGKRALESVADHADRPDVGVAPSLSEAIADVKQAAGAFNPFAGNAVAQVPPSPAPSTAVAAAPPTAPATSAPPAPAVVPPAPTPAPEAAVPAAPAAPASPAGIEVDADGLPWDARIHAGGRAKNADGRWRQKRGLNDAALKARVEAELRQAMGAPAVASVPVPPPAPAVVPPPLTTESPATAVPAAPTVTPAAPVAAETFPSFMARVGSAMVAGTKTQEQVNAALAAVGLTTVAQLALRPDLLPAVSAALA